jgi:pyrroloquinoline quinone (PQQ) biosynthesis protein C
MAVNAALADELEALLHDIFVNPPGWWRYYHSPEFSRAGAIVWIEQFGHFVRHFPRWMAQIVANCPEQSVRAQIIDNLYDEEVKDPRGDAAHYELFVRRGLALGLSREAVDAAPALPTTLVSIQAWTNMVRTRSWLEGLSAMMVLERTNDASLAAKWGTKRQTDPRPWFNIGLTQYDARSNLVHEEADLEHGGSEDEILLTYATTPELQQAVVQTARESLVTWRLFNDGILQQIERVTAR